MGGPLFDQVANQYEEWIYPEPIHDLPAWLASNWQWFDPSHAHRLFWPDRDYRAGMDILIAGCGTNQGAVFAYTNPSAKVVAIDVSQASLDHHALLKRKYGLNNLTLQRLPIEEVQSLQQEFDLVISTGVLHHLADPLAGLKALATCLRPDGVVAIMVYARYGRIGVEMLQAVFRELGLTQDSTSLALVREGMACLPDDHPVRGYMNVAPDLAYDAGLVDTFLHGRDRSYTVADCMDLVSASGLVFQDWFLKSSYEPFAISDNPFLKAVAALPNDQRWGVMERMNHRNACHFFMACRPERPTGSYRIGRDEEQWLDAVPFLRYRCGLDGERIVRPGWALPLTAEQLALVRLVDGRRTIREIIAEASASGQGSRSSAEREPIARALFGALVNRDFLSLGLSVHQ